MTITAEQNKINKIINKAKQDIENAPSGTLQIYRNHGTTQYYNVEGATRKYIPQAKEQTAKELAQKDYAQKVLNKLEPMQKVLNRFAESYKHISTAEIYKNLSEDKQKLVQPYELSDKEYAEKWLSEPYTKLQIKDGTPIFKTDRGETVRSKSELLIANKLNAHGLKYKYECPLKLNSSLTYFPDFTILHPKTREEWYLEHFGMLSNAEYLESSVIKILNYTQNGYPIGNRFLVTFETAITPFQPIHLEKLIKTFFE